MQKDFEINTLILNNFHELSEKYINLKAQEENGLVDSYEFCIKVLLPYILQEIKNKNDDVVKRLMNLLEKMVLSNDEYLVNYGMAVIVEDIVNSDVDLDYFMSFTNDNLNKKIQPVIDYFNSGKSYK